MMEALRVAAVIVLLSSAAVLATRPGKLPLALRGLAKMLNRNPPQAAEDTALPLWKRLLAFLLVIASAALAMI